MRRDEESGASKWGGGRAERATDEWIREPREVERVESRVSGFGSHGASISSGRLQCIITVFRYLLLGKFVRPGFISLGYKYKPRPLYQDHLSDQYKIRTFTFRLMPTLRSRSRVDLGEFFGK
jgi:hypothetical protein